MNKFKILLGVVFLICALFFDVKFTYAQNNEGYTISDSDFLNGFYTGELNIIVTDPELNDVTQEFRNKTYSYYLSKDEDVIKHIIAENKLVLHRITSINNFGSSVQARAYSRYKTVVSDMQYFVLYDQYGSSTIAVLSELTGGIWYDENTSRVTDVTNATYNIISIDTNSNLNITANNFATGSSVQNGKGYFWGKCNFIGQGTIVQNGVSISVNRDFGSKKVSFYAVP